MTENSAVVLVLAALRALSYPVKQRALFVGSSAEDTHCDPDPTSLLEFGVLDGLKAMLMPSKAA